MPEPKIGDEVYDAKSDRRVIIQNILLACAEHSPPKYSVCVVGGGSHYLRDQWDLYFDQPEDEPPNTKYEVTKITTSIDFQVDPQEWIGKNVYDLSGSNDIMTVLQVDRSLDGNIILYCEDRWSKNWYHLSELRAA